VSRGRERPFCSGERHAWAIRIWKAQGKICAVCGLDMVPSDFTHPRQGWTIEHCWPRRRYRFEHRGNLLVSHAACNNLKADRDPTGCELVMLEIVNARLGWELEEIMNEYADEMAGPGALALALLAAQERRISL
jgi:hypothetical protein